MNSHIPVKTVIAALERLKLEMEKYPWNSDPTRVFSHTQREIEFLISNLSFYQSVESVRIPAGIRRRKQKKGGKRK